MTAYRKTNNKGITYEFVDSIPEITKPITHYNTRSTHHEFDENRYYYFNNDNVYEKINETTYKKLYINRKANGCDFVNMFDKNNKRVSVYFNKLDS